MTAAPNSDSKFNTLKLAVRVFPCAATNFAVARARPPKWSP